jgi:hypothetical protein
MTIREFGRDGHRERGLIRESRLEWTVGHLACGSCGLNHRMGKRTLDLCQLWTESQNGKVDTWFVPGVD